MRIVGNQSVTCRFAKFDVLVHGHRFDDFHCQSVSVAKFLQPSNFVAIPHFADGHVVHRRHHARHTGDLFDAVEWYAVLFAIPPKCKFHLFSSACAYTQSTVKSVLPSARYAAKSTNACTFCYKKPYKQGRLLAFFNVVAILCYLLVYCGAMPNFSAKVTSSPSTNSAHVGYLFVA